MLLLLTPAVRWTSSRTFVLKICLREQVCTRQLSYQRFLPIIAPPSLMNSPVLTMEDHGPQLMQLFHRHKPLDRQTHAYSFIRKWDLLPLTTSMTRKPLIFCSSTKEISTPSIQLHRGQRCLTKSCLQHGRRWWLHNNNNARVRTKNPSTSFASKQGGGRASLFLNAGERIWWRWKTCCCLANWYPAD